MFTVYILKLPNLRYESVPEIFVIIKYVNREGSDESVSTDSQEPSLLLHSTIF